MVGRNDPCWCGSGKKYKKCHMALDARSGMNTSPKPVVNKMVKTPEQIQAMRKAGTFNGECMDFIRPFIKAGITTEEINTRVHDYTVRHGHTCGSLGYHGFPKSVCVSVNDVVCLGIPSAEQILREGDIVNVDITTIVAGFYGDSSETFLIGAVSDQTRRLVTVSAKALLKAIAAVGPGKPLSVVGQTIQPYVESEGCSIVRQYTGHGIGKKFHEFFAVCHHQSEEDSHIILEPGMTFTIEPMINAGDYKVVVDKNDGWTVRTKDGSLSAQFEHTVLVTEQGCEVLTKTPSQIASGTLLPGTFLTGV
jgi:methionyl aminopeptidase